MDLKDKIKKILEEFGCLEKHKIGYLKEVYNEVRNEELIDALFDLHIVSRSFICVSEKTPPDNVELLVQDSYGNKHLTSWRKSYGIFMCQNKNETSDDWLWMQI